jgi:hypothetical protein
MVSPPLGLREDVGSTPTSGSSGAIAQAGERRLCTADVGGSIPSGSTGRMGVQPIRALGGSLRVGPGQEQSGCWAQHE